MRESENRKSRPDVCSEFGRKTKQKVFYMTGPCPEHSCFKNKHFSFWTQQGLGISFVLLNSSLLALTGTKKTLDKHELYFSEPELHAFYTTSSQHNSTDFTQLFRQHQEK